MELSLSQGCNIGKDYSKVDNSKKTGMSAQEFRNCLVELLNLINVLIRTVEMAGQTAESRYGLSPNLNKNSTTPPNFAEKFERLNADMYRPIPERDTSAPEPDRSAVKRDKSVPGLERSVPERDGSVPVREGFVLGLERSVADRKEPVPERDTFLLKRGRSGSVLNKPTPQDEPLTRKFVQYNPIYFGEVWHSINFTECSEKMEKSPTSDKKEKEEKEEKELDTSSFEKPPEKPSSTVFYPEKKCSESEYFSAKEEPNASSYNKSPVPPSEEIYFDALESQAVIIETSSSVTVYFDAEDQMVDPVDPSVDTKSAQHTIQVTDSDQELPQDLTFDESSTTLRSERQDDSKHWFTGKG